MTLTPFTMTIDNEAREAGDGATLESLAPFPQTPWATYPAASAADVDEAVRSAHDAWTNSWWRHDPRKRSQALLHLADLVDSAAPRLGDIESIDCGKAMREAQGVAGAMSGFFRYAAALCLAHPTGTIQQGATPQNVQHTVRQPYGVIAVQVPWNQPLGVLVQETAMALAAGNAIVVKPSEFNPCSVLEFGTIIRESQLPPGIFNVISGLGPVAGAALCEHPLVRKIVFTGGGEAARVIARAAAERLVPLVLELGGKSPTLVFEDADLDLAASGIVAGFTGGTGQSCTAASRTLVHRPVYDAFAEKLVAAAAGVKIGDPADPTVAMGPLTSAEHHARVTARVQNAMGEGARLLHGGGRPASPSPVADHPLFFEPTIFADVAPSMTIFREEVFGPVTCLVPFEDEKEAIAIANDTAFGLTASMWTNDVNRISRLVGELHAGTVWVNGHRAGDPSYAFGGLGESGYGRLNGIAGYEEMSYLKSVRWAFQPAGS
jgi:aldehyde dehydrogenase (NAD+)